VDHQPQPTDGQRPGAGEPLDLTVVVPAYNEADRLEEGLPRLARSLGAVPGRRVEVVVVDDGSTDGTAARAEHLAGLFTRARVLRQPANRGKGAAVRAGVAAARAPEVAFMDADMSIDPDQLGALVAALGRADVAIGSRAGPDGAVDYDSRWRTTMGRAFNRLVNAVTGVGLADTQCGFKAFRTPVARLLFHLGVVDRFAFDVEVLAWARHLGLAVAEVPVTWRHVADSSVRPLTDPLSMLADVLRARAGLPAPPALQALVLAPGAGRTDLEAVSSLAGRHLPLVHAGGQPLLLFPLLAPSEVAPLVDHLTTACPGLVVDRRTVTAAALRRLAPLTVDDVDATPRLRTAAGRR
jgi:hypothetical protein